MIMSIIETSDGTLTVEDGTELYTKTWKASIVR
jgi:hypothetical protein